MRVTWVTPLHSDESNPKRKAPFDRPGGESDQRTCSLLGFLRRTAPMPTGSSVAASSAHNGQHPSGCRERPVRSWG